jgi:hypothetical protein
MFGVTVSQMEKLSVQEVTAEDEQADDCHRNRRRRSIGAVVPTVASFANSSEVPGNGRIKMGWDCETGLEISRA